MASTQSPTATERKVAFSQKHFRPSVHEDIKQDPYTLSKRARMYIRTITNRYTNSDHEIGVFEADLRDLWYLFIQAAKAIPEPEPAADQLACQVLRARNFGTVSRLGSDKSAGTTRGERAITSTNQRIWVDLPFLVDALQSAWRAAPSDMTAVERRNLAGFTARLASFGIYTDELISCALGSFASALEFSPGAEIADQISVLVVWLRYCGFEMLSASARSYQNAEITTGIAPGDLFKERNAEAGPGFTVARWDFWKERLNELQQSSDPGTAEQLQLCVGMMVSAEEIVGARSHARDDALRAYFECSL